MDALACLSCLFFGMVVVAMGVGAVVALRLVMGSRGPVVPAAVDAALKAEGFEPLGLRAWTGEVDGTPVLVHWRPILGRRGGAAARDRDPSQLEVMVPCAVAPGGECVTRRDARARREPTFDGLYRTGAGVSERLSEEVKAVLVELAEGPVRFIDLLDAGACVGKRQGWQDGQPAFLVGRAAFDAEPGAGVNERACALREAASRMEAS